VVVAIIGIISAIAAFSIRQTEYAGTVHGFAAEVAAELDAAAASAVGTRRIHQVTFTGAGTDYRIEIDRCQTVGMGACALFDPVRQLYPPRKVQVNAIDLGVQDVTGGGNPGTGVPSTLFFSPDGSSTGATIYIHDQADRRRARVAVYPITSSTHVFDHW